MTDRCGARLAAAIGVRVVRNLQRPGKRTEGGEDPAAVDAADSDADLLLDLGAAAGQRREVLGERADAPRREPQRTPFIA